MNKAINKVFLLESVYAFSSCISLQIGESFLCDNFRATLLGKWLFQNFLLILSIDKLLFIYCFIYLTFKWHHKKLDYCGSE